MRSSLHRLLWNHPGHAWRAPIRWVDRWGYVQAWSHQLASWFCDHVWCDFEPEPPKPMRPTFTINNTAAPSSVTFTMTASSVPPPSGGR